MSMLSDFGLDEIAPDPPKVGGAEVWILAKEPRLLELEMA